jgi:dTDP-4-amino-4,6-dideoxygalactose transaminase
MEQIPVFRPMLPDLPRISTYISSIDSSKHYTNRGPLVLSLEERIAHHLGVNKSNIVMCANATLGLEGAYETSELDGSWFCPAWTFAATPSSLIRARKEFVFCDVDSDWRIQVPVENVKESLIVDVLPFGSSSRIQDFNPLVKGLVIDAAASFDSIQNFETGNRSFPVSMVGSFHATKSLPGAEGGFFWSNDIEWVSRFRKWISFGFDENRNAIQAGTNAKMHEYSAAIIHSSLDSWASDKEEWLDLKDWAFNLSSQYGFELFSEPDHHFATPYWIVKGSSEKIESLRRIFAENDIQTRNWWGEGCQKMPAFKEVRKFDLINTEKIAKQSTGLPFFRGMPEEFKKRISDTFAKL